MKKKKSKKLKTNIIMYGKIIKNTYNELELLEPHNVHGAFPVNSSKK
ncbi:MAG: hypothetical protein ACE3L7_07330 [Candidatus Pristimantibacillus sp.]